MQIKDLFCAAALAWSASAFVTTSDIAKENREMAAAIEPFIENIESVSGQVAVRLSCNGCAVAQNGEDGGRIWDEAGDKMTDIVLNFERRPNEILLGDAPIYPPRPQLNKPAMGRQVKAESAPGDFTVTEDELFLATHVEIGERKMLAAGPQLGFFTREVRVEILGLEDKVVHVGTVAFEVLENGEDLDSEAKRVVMGPLDVIPTITTLADAQCTTIICRVRAQIAAKLMAMRMAMGKLKNGCMRMMGMHQHGGQRRPGQHPHGHHGQPADGNAVDRLQGGPNKFRGPMGKKPCPNAGRHGAIRKVLHGLAIFSRHVLMPVLVGVAAGMAVSALGMVIGQIFFMIWMRLRSKKNGGYIAIYQVEQSDDLENGEEEPLPKYEPADVAMPPAYSDEKTENEN